jgi:DNA-binding response OmpR family regulator
MRVLVVEDTIELAELFELWLSLAEIEAVTVSRDFDQLLAPQIWEGIEVAVVDLMLGDRISGVAILAWLYENRPDVRRIVCSAMDLHDEEVTGAADVILRKPVTRDAFVEAVRSD